MKKGKLFVISGSSGVGKGTMVSAILERNPEIKLSISTTTRPPRPNEENGVNYFFITKEEFQEQIKNENFFEWAEFADNFYGTSKKFLEDSINQGQSIILEIDVQGAFQVKEKCKEAILIFILPPSMEELKNRLTNRKTETFDIINKRMSLAEKEFAQKDKFDYQIINNELEKAIIELENIINLERGIKC